jgi:hypothetical protein
MPTLNWIGKEASLIAQKALRGYNARRPTRICIKLLYPNPRVSASLSTRPASGPSTGNDSDGNSPSTRNIQQCLIPSTGGRDLRRAVVIGLTAVRPFRQLPVDLGCT